MLAAGVVGEGGASIVGSILPETLSRALEVRMKCFFPGADGP